MKSGFARGVVRWARSPEWLGLSALLLFTLAAVLGYGVFGLHPHLIPPSDSAARFYATSFQFFARVHIAVAAVALMVPLIWKTGVRWLPAFVAVGLVSFLSEFIGTGYGFPFGGYEYSSLLGWKLGGRVPLLIPLSWFLMALPSWAMALAALPGQEQRWGRAILGAYLLTAWDLALDPAMSFLTPYWVWEETGLFYGMPWVNLAGWMGTGMALMGVMELLGSRRWVSSLDPRWLIAYYGVVLLMPLGMILVAGLWTAVLATLGALALPWSLLRVWRAFSPPERTLILAQDRHTT